MLIIKQGVKRALLSILIYKLNADFEHAFLCCYFLWQKTPLFRPENNPEIYRRSWDSSLERTLMNIWQHKEFDILTRL